MCYIYTYYIYCSCYETVDSECHTRFILFICNVTKCLVIVVNCVLCPLSEILVLLTGGAAVTTSVVVYTYTF